MPGVPRVLLNCAASLDGRLAAPDGAPLRLSGPQDMRRVHAMRAEADAILVGVGTVAADDPSLRVKADLLDAGVDVRHPLRVVLDTEGRTPASSRVLTDGHPTLVFTSGEKAVPGAETVRVPRSQRGLDLRAVLAALDERGVGILMVEGGGRVMRSFIEAGLFDRFTLYVAPVLVGGGPSLWPGGPPLHRLGARSTEVLGDGVLWTFSPGPSRPDRRS